MPEFHVVKCVSCRVFQVQQVKVVNKWACLRCGAKQTLQKVYGISAKAKDCRLVCQNLNMAVGEAEKCREDALLTAADQDPGGWGDEVPEHQAAAQHNPQRTWSEYVEPEEPDVDGRGAEPGRDGFTTELASGAGHRRKAAAAAAPGGREGGRRAPKQQRRVMDDEGSGRQELGQGRAMHSGAVQQQQQQQQQQHQYQQQQQQGQQQGQQQQQQQQRQPAAAYGLGDATAAPRFQADAQQRSWQVAGRDSEGHAQQGRGSQVQQGSQAQGGCRFQPPGCASQKQQQQQARAGPWQQQQQQQQEASCWRSSHQVDDTALYSLDVGPTDQHAPNVWPNSNSRHVQRSMQQPATRAQKPAAAAKWAAFVEEEAPEEGDV